MCLIGLVVVEVGFFVMINFMVLFGNFFFCIILLKDLFFCSIINILILIFCVVDILMGVVCMFFLCGVFI